MSVPTRAGRKSLVVHIIKNAVCGYSHFSVEDVGICHIDLMKFRFFATSQIRANRKSEKSPLTSSQIKSWSKLSFPYLSDVEIENAGRGFDRRAIPYDSTTSSHPYSNIERCRLASIHDTVGSFRVAIEVLYREIFNCYLSSLYRFAVIKLPSHRLPLFPCVVCFRA